MLLSIDNGKVAELLRSSGGGYVVSSSDVQPVAGNYTAAYPTSSEASGTVCDPTSRVTIETRERLLSARREIERSGAPLKNPDELTAEIEEMRTSR
jgi:hypothetical protein